MRLFARCILPGLAILHLAGHAQADLLFSQPVINGGVALASDFARSQQEADNFALAQSASVLTIHWWGAYANNDLPTDHFTLRFFADVAGNPAMTPFVDLSSVSLTRTATNLVDNLGDQVYDYQATLPSPISFNEGTNYYLSLVNNTGDWDWVGSGPGMHWARPDDTSAWTLSANTTNFAFELSGGAAVPEPSALLLLAIGTVGLMGWAWRRNKSLARADGSGAHLRSSSAEGGF
jgi:hypothetical protein